MAYGAPIQISTSTDPAATRLGSNNLVTLASDGTAAVAWYDGTNQQLSYAASPYSSWTTAQLVAFHRFAVSMLIKDAPGNLAIMACDNVNGINYYTATKSGSAYSVGTANFIGSASASTFNAGGVEELIIDPQGRYWSISNAANNATLQVYYSATPASGTWTTSSLSMTPASNAQLPVAALIGNYLVIVVQTAGGYQYQRLDVSQVSLGSWSAAASVAHVTGTPGATNNFCLRGNSAGVGVFVYDSASGIQGQTYTASNDTWSTATAITSVNSDVQPTAVVVGNDFYVYFCQFAASNSYALAWTHYSNTNAAWDLSVKQLVPSGTNITNPNAAYANGVIGVLYTVGTTSPYAVNFVTMTTVKPALSAPNSMPVVSRSVPAFTNDDFSGSYPASNANNAVYNDAWRCAATPTGNANSGALTTPVYVAYDLSGVPSPQRQNVALAWYNDFVNGASYDPSVIGNNADNVPTNYTVESNTGAGGGSPPSSGWTTLATVNNSSPIHSMLHLVNLAGANWIRVRVTGIIGSSGNNNAQFNMDIHDAHSAVYPSTQIVQDAFKAFGDSITAAAFLHADTILPVQVQALASSHFPIIEDAGVGGWTSTDMLPHFVYWLSLFPGQFVFINLGTNDANQGGSYLPTFKGNMDAMVKMVLSVGKIPVVPRMPWGGTTNLLANVSTLNSQIDSVVANNPGCMAGPDLYAFFNAHQSEISASDHIHPTTQGYLDYQNLWAKWIVANIYTSGDPNTFAFDRLHFAMQG